MRDDILQDFLDTLRKAIADQTPIMFQYGEKGKRLVHPSGIEFTDENNYILKAFEPLEDMMKSWRVDRIGGPIIRIPGRFEVPKVEVIKGGNNVWTEANAASSERINAVIFTMDRDRDILSTLIDNTRTIVVRNPHNPTQYLIATIYQAMRVVR